MRSCYLLYIENAEGLTTPVLVFETLADAEEYRRQRLNNPDVAKATRVLNAAYRIHCCEFVADGRVPGEEL